MLERTEMVVLTKDEYKELIEKAERIALIERLLDNGNYISVEELHLILNIKKENSYETV